MAGQLQCLFKQQAGVQIVSDEGPEQPHLLFHQRAFFPVRKHRIEINDLRRFALPLGHQLDGIALTQAHAFDDSAHFGILATARQAILQQRSDQRLALEQDHFTTQGRQHEGIAPEPGRGVQHAGANARLDADRLGDHLTAAAAELTTMRGAPFDEIHPYRTRRLWTEQLQLQPGLAQLQGEHRFIHMG